MANDEGLSLGYRIGWRIRRTAMAIFGPAQLGQDDPIEALNRERAAKVVEARAKRTGR